MPRRRTQKQNRVHKDAAVRPCKKKNKSTTHHLPRIWDELSSISTIFVTRRALKELDRRNTLLSAGYLGRQSTSNSFAGDIKRFARHGGPDLLDLRAYPEPSELSAFTMGPTRSGTRNPEKDVRESTKTKTSRSGRSSAYDSNFRRLLIEHHITAPDRRSKPTNLDLWKQKIAQGRASLSENSQVEEKYEEFLDAVANAKVKDEVMSDVIPRMKGRIRYPSTTNRPCNNWAPLWPEASSSCDNLVVPKPDQYEGTELSAQNAQVRKDLGPWIVPSSRADAPFLANFFIEAKGPGGSGEVAVDQARHDGSLGARGMHRLQSYTKSKGAELYDQSAYTVSATYVNGQLKLYLHHLSQPETAGSEPRYYMFPLGGWTIDSNLDGFCAGVRAFRNARDAAYEYREHFLEASQLSCANDQEEDSVGAVPGSHNDVSCASAAPHDIPSPALATRQPMIKCKFAVDSSDP